MSKSSHLTSHKPGGIRELVTLSLPLIAIALSENLMIIFDRIILSHYSLEALNIVTIASQCIEIFIYGIWAVTSISEIFVTVSYAENNFYEMATSCWQMIWLSLGSLLIIIPAGIYLGPLVLKSNYQALGLPYFNLMLYTIPLVGIISSLASFFVGQGQTKVLLISTLVINIMNLVFDFVFIFGVKGLVPAMGPLGAALSAVLSLLIQVIWLLFIFLSRVNRKKHRTHYFYLKASLFIQCIKVGLPVAVGHVAEMTGWLLILIIVSHANELLLTVVSIGSTIYLIFSFIIDGLNRCLSTLASNHLAHDEPNLVVQSFNNSLRIVLGLLVLLMVPLIFKPHLVLSLFNLPQHEGSWKSILNINLIFLWAFLLFDALLWLVSAILTAYRDTKFIMYTNILSMSIFTLLPVAYLFYINHLNPSYIWLLFCCYVFFSVILLAIRAYYMHTKEITE